MQLVLCLVICVYCTLCDGETLQLMRLLMSKQCQGRRVFSAAGLGPVPIYSLSSFYFFRIAFSLFIEALAWI